MVLNAFRHHGIGHDPDLSVWNDKGGAQRLPASWNRSHLYDHSGITIATVLNAFRHHGIGHIETEYCQYVLRMCSTPSGIMESVTAEYMLNELKDCGCSTPSGIMESVTVPYGTRRDKDGKCSTPSGIMESVTPFFSNSVPGRLLCSTPSGIMESVTIAMLGGLL